MIQVTRFNGTRIVLNADWVQSVEETPDTLITLTTGYKLLVKDKADEVVDAIIKYKRETAPAHGISHGS
ncbi:MAG: flagellar FlbD family protein [Planctomycetota bacterium]